MEQTKKILVVEDEDDLRVVLKARLEDAGYEVVTASNGKEGLETASQEDPDLIISDVIMPVMDGFEFNKALKQDKRTAEIPFLVLTARWKMEDAFRVIGVDDFIAKPFESKALLVKVKALLEQPAQKPKSDKKILVAGLTEALISNMASQLEDIGCVTDTAMTGQDVITKVVQMEPDIILLDALPMDDISAYEVIETLRKMSQSDRKPILIYSYFETEGVDEVGIHFKTSKTDAHKSLCMEAGANGYIGKFQERSFIKIMGQYLYGGS